MTVQEIRVGQVWRRIRDRQLVRVTRIDRVTWTDDMDENWIYVEGTKSCMIWSPNFIKWYELEEDA
ncbi:hypothetical protein [Microbacterium sp. No. 7]|uniref:hypothetical protein n=1 Tax=Microbacterium sp. No. 7 TaxID=1714373 RepID=UPI0006D1C63B|nr:hypothetical protein [Microbacterium sp. No. 7]ALJ19542.1 hypothetical protein AOA12_06310 [Microbacterium sp. No. 7]